MIKVSAIASNSYLTLLEQCEYEYNNIMNMAWDLWVWYDGDSSKSLDSLSTATINSKAQAISACLDVKIKLLQLSSQKNLIINPIDKVQTAITRMYNNGLTSFQTVADFNWDWELTREQASKFFTQFTKIILNKNPDETQTVKLSDLNKADKSLQPFIIESNQLWLFKGVDWKFYPFNKLTRAQAIAVLMRAKEWYQNESNGKRYSEYYNLADNYWLLTDLSFNFESLDYTNIKRKEIALMLYRLGSK